MALLFATIEAAIYGTKPPATITTPKMATLWRGGAIRGASSLLSAEMNNTKIVVFSEEDPGKHYPKGKAKSARPFKPAIYME